MRACVNRAFNNQPLLLLSFHTINPDARLPPYVSMDQDCYTLLLVYNKLLDASLSFLGDHAVSRTERFLLPTKMLDEFLSAVSA